MSAHMSDDSASSQQLERGLSFEQQGDLASAEREYTLADQAGSAVGALVLGGFLKRRGDYAGAEAAYRRSEARGDPRASCDLAVLLENLGDVNGAKAAYHRADERGFAGGAYGLGQLLYAEGDIDGSIAANRRADELGDADAAYNLGFLLEQQGDLAGAEAAFGRADQRGHAGGAAAYGRLQRDRGDHTAAEPALRRADERGDPNGAYELGILLLDQQDVHGAVQAFERAAERGHPNAAEVAKMLREQAVASPPTPAPSASVAWAALRDALVRVGARDQNGTALVYEMPLGHSGHTRQAWISYEVVKPDYELVLLHSHIAPLGSVDLTELVKRAGQLLIGKLGFVPHPDSAASGGGFLTLGASIPLSLLTGNDGAAAVMFHLALLTSAAAQLDPASHSSVGGA
jgi:tetratricopeptide (TPR) repeat protein